MILGCQLPEKFAAHSATACYDGGLALQNNANWLDRTAAQFRAAITLHIPEGYQDGTSFHYGIAPTAKASRAEPQPPLVFIEPNQF